MASEIPDDDATESQHEQADAARSQARASVDPEAPEADVLEQAQIVAEEDGLLEVSPDPEAPEADVFEQAMVVPIDDDEERGGKG